VASRRSVVKRKSSRSAGFTLAELLIVITILGEIATFTIPKIVYAQVNSQMNSVVKEDFSTLAQAFQSLSLDKGVSATTTSNDLGAYLTIL